VKVHPSTAVGHSSEAGLTLVELMISMTLGLLLVLSLIAIYLNSRQIFNVQNNLARMQESARVAIGTLTREIQATGFMGCANEANDGKYGTTRPIKAYASLTAYNADPGNPALNSTKFSDVQPPILVVRHGSNNTIPVSGEMAAGGTASDIPIASDPDKWSSTTPRLIISDCVSADGFTPTKVTATAIEHPELSRAYGDDARVMTEETSVFFLAKPTGRTFTSLYQHSTNGAMSQDLRLADYVGEWSLRYGYGDEDGIIVGYTDITGINARVKDWSTVKSVQVHLLLTSRLPVLDRPAQYIFNFKQADTPADRLLRKEFATTIALRNRLTLTH
jgi:type IV pilus assembly protein PilW